MFRNLRNKFLRSNSRNFFSGQFSNKEFLVTLRADLTKAQETMKADLTKAQEASENRLNKAQEAMKADSTKAQEASEQRLISAQNSLKGDIKLMMDSQVYKIVTIVAGIFFSSLAIFGSIGRNYEVPVLKK